MTETVDHLLEIAALTEWIQVARGLVPADLCLRNARIVNVFTGSVQEGDLAVHGGRFVGWGRYDAVRRLDLNGAYVAPGFIDGHLHMESTLLGPSAFWRAVLPRGTTAVVLDPHEIANVLGVAGIRYLLGAAGKLPVDLFFMLPSCVPASPLETSGAVLRGADLQTLRSHPRVLGLAEVMNFPGLLASDPQVLEKVALFQDGPMDGHAPFVSGEDLNAYTGVGIRTDHEATTLQEAQEKLSKGMMLMIREGSQSKDLEALLPAVTDATWPRCMLVCDDRHPTDLLRDGHMDAVVNRAVSLGLDPVRAMAMATINPARHFGLKDRGAIAPGYRADFSVSPTLHPWTPVRVFKNGVEWVRDGAVVEGMDQVPWEHEGLPESPMWLPPLRQEDLRVRAEGARLRVITVHAGSLITDQDLVEVRPTDGYVAADPAQDLLKVAVYNRYVPTDPPGPAVGFVRGFGLQRGAVASTVAHDSHNLVVVGASDSAMIVAAKAVAATGGGLAVADDDHVLASLALPIAGLMSPRPLEEVCRELDALNRAARSLGSTLPHPFMALSFVALPVIPRLKITDRGLVDVEAFQLVPLFVRD
ncbi:Adenine deaminase [Desulfacinum hydrothermale DSM 13146]|uniref:Adenine deaminase n=1 Tax=Desulfacinum hydrothermale DSM 13146 TaxID=1121390 RepID=A0A1W1XUH0_9BACT|nr:adenine deaminase [Desulfacinum hydrothermale]SMC27603.1 Adenine deaminase [Desulfacinum hydrothermale DSM 13146]